MNFNYRVAKDLFISDAQAELLRMSIVPTPDGNGGIDNKVLANYHLFIHGFANKIKLHTFFLPDNLNQITTDIFKDNILRDFVFCLRDRYMVSLGEQARELCLIIARYAGNPSPDKSVPPEMSLIPELIPDTIRASMTAPARDVREILENNTFLLVPIMLYLCYSELLNDKD